MEQTHTHALDTEHSPSEKEQRSGPPVEKSKEHIHKGERSSGRKPDMHYSIRFREKQPILSASSRIQNLSLDEEVMVQTDHGLEPAVVCNRNPKLCDCAAYRIKASHLIPRRCTREEKEKYTRIVEREQEALQICKAEIERLELPMKLISVERFFNGSKIIFYFTADNRVDFRELVKSMVLEFRTRVEMRQIGVRHETKMLGGIGCCGLELCCCSYIKNFAPVSIKMAKEQDLPLNPGKISGICNRLLCCLTYEYEYYREFKRHLPKAGKTVRVDDHSYKILNINVACETMTVVDLEDPEKIRVLKREEWEPLCAEHAKKHEGKKPETARDGS